MPRNDRSGSAIIAALALLALGAALLAGTFAALRSATRSNQSHAAALVAQSEARIAIAHAASPWSTAFDSLPIGVGVAMALPSRAGGIAGLPVRTSLRVDRLTADTYSIAAESEVGPLGSVFARRRMRQLLRRPAITDSSAAPPPPAPIARWSVADIY